MTTQKQSIDGLMPFPPRDTGRDLVREHDQRIRKTHAMINDRNTYNSVEDTKQLLRDWEESCDILFKNDPILGEFAVFRVLQDYKKKTHPIGVEFLLNISACTVLNRLSDENYAFQSTEGRKHAALYNGYILTAEGKKKHPLQKNYLMGAYA